MSDDEKPIRTKWQEFEVQVFGYTWIATWFAAIWWEAYRGPLFLTGLLCLFYGMLAVSSTRKRPKSPTP